MEKDLSAKFKKAWKPGYYKRVEPKSCAEGIPDVDLRLEGSKFFFKVELKFEKEKFKNKKLEIRNSQKMWFLKNQDTLSFILYQVADKYYVFDANDIMYLTQDKVSWDGFVDKSHKFNDIESVCRYLQWTVSYQVKRSLQK
jgi:hypothetical protein